MSRRILPALAAVALVAGLSACGDGGAGTVTTPPPDLGDGGTSDGGGASDGGGSGDEASDGGGGGPVAAPDIPAPDPADYPGMDEQTPEGAEQAFKYFVALSYWAYQTGETSTMEESYSVSCEGCRDIVEEVNRLVEADALWSDVAVEEVEVVTYNSEDFDHEIGYAYVLSEHMRSVSGGSAAESIDESRYVAVGGMDWDEDAWQVGALDIGSEDELAGEGD